MLGRPLPGVKQFFLPDWHPLCLSMPAEFGKAGG